MMTGIAGDLNMSIAFDGIRGTIRGGVVVFTQPTTLPEGTEVEVKPTHLEFTPEDAAEFAGWEQLGDEAWAMIDDWEKEDPNRATG
jgi:hypothetical protein